MSTWLAVRVIGTFLLLITVFFFVLTYDPILKVIDIGAGLAHLSALLSYGVLKVIGAIGGFPVHRMHTIMGSSSFEVDVAPACSGAVPTSITWRRCSPTPPLALAHHRRRARHRHHQIVNFFRVSALFLIGLFFHEIFHDTHVYVAQALVVCVAVALWLFWVTRYADAPAH
jgi:hypothetical protein